MHFFSLCKYFKLEHITIDIIFEVMFIEQIEQSSINWHNFCPEALKSVNIVENFVYFKSSN